MARNQALTWPRVIASVVILGIAAYSQYTDSETSPVESSERTERDQGRGQAAHTDAGVQAIVQAHANRRSNVIVEARGEVFKALPDDNDGSRHQRLLVRLAGGHTILIAHNIDLAPRAPARRGDMLGFKGEYEWNARGGVVHWTHHDPAGRHPGGWLELDGERFD